MIRSGRTCAAFWRRQAPTLRHPVASGTLCCPICDATTPVLVFRCRTRRTPASPHLVAYAMPPTATPDALDADQQQHQDETVSDGAIAATDRNGPGSSRAARTRS